MNIHPTAVVGADVQLADDVEIGPYAVLNGNIDVAAATRIASHVVIEGTVLIGSNNMIGPGAVIGAAPQDLSFDPKTRSEVRIGNDNVIREHCTIHRGTTEGSATTMGNGNFLMVGVHVGHNCAIGDGVIIANNVLMAGYVTIMDRAFIGGGTTFHQNMRVGRYVMAQGSSAFGKDLPPFTLAAERNAVFGLNVVGLRRAGFSADQRTEVKRAFKLLYLSGQTLRQAAIAAATQEWTEVGREFFDFVAAAGSRGVCPYRGKRELS